MRSVIGREQLAGSRVRARSSRTPTMTRSGLVKTSMALPSRRFSGEQANETVRPSGGLAPCLLQRRHCADRQLRRAEHHGAVSQIGKSACNLSLDVRHVGAVVLVDRRVEGDPHDVGIPNRFRSIRGELQRTRSKPAGDRDQPGPARRRRAAGRQRCDRCRVRVEGRHVSVRPTARHAAVTEPRCQSPRTATFTRASRAGRDSPAGNRASAGRPREW